MRDLFIVQMVEGTTGSRADSPDFLPLGYYVADFDRDRFVGRIKMDIPIIT